MFYTHFLLEDTHIKNRFCFGPTPRRGGGLYPLKKFYELNDQNPMKHKKS